MGFWSEVFKVDGYAKHRKCPYCEEIGHEDDMIEEWWSDPYVDQQCTPDYYHKDCHKKVRPDKYKKCKKCGRTLG